VVARAGGIESLVRSERHRPADVYHCLGRADARRDRCVRLPCATCNESRSHRRTARHV